MARVEWDMYATRNELAAREQELRRGFVGHKGALGESPMLYALTALALANVTREIREDSNDYRREAFGNIDDRRN